MKGNKHIRINPELFIAVGLVLFVICSSGSFNILSGDYGACSAFTVLGKLELIGVDKVVVSTSDDKMTITEEDVIDRIVNETRIATHTTSDCHQGCCGCDFPHRSIELYRGDKLVRLMEWQGCCDFIEVYKPDLIHWLFPPLDESADAGYIEMSDDLVDRLSALIEA